MARRDLTKNYPVEWPRAMVDGEPRVRGKASAVISQYGSAGSDRYGEDVVGEAGAAGWE